jgi:hypothetical protein
MTGTFSNPAGAAREAAQAYTRALLDLLGDREPLAVQDELPRALERAVAGLSETLLRTPEKPGKWSVIDVVQHLADSEMVYGYRIRLILASDRPAIEGYDQDAWAGALRYRDAPLNDALDQIRVARGANLRLMRGLAPEQWERYGMHSERGPESVRHIASLLAAHDLVHRRQIQRIRAAIGAG